MTAERDIFLLPSHLCETQAGDIAYAIGRVQFKAGRPMLVEHVGGLYLEHDLKGRVLTAGYGSEYNIVHLRREEEEPHNLPQVLRLFM